MKQLIILILCYIPMALNGQVFDQDSVFFLEKKTLALGKSITGKNKNAIIGFTARVGTGYMDHHNAVGFGGFQQASSIPAFLEFGYRMMWLELNYRYGTSGLSLGQDASWLAETPGDGILASYSLSLSTGVKTQLGIAKWHFNLLKVPMFVQFGTGFSNYEFSNKPVTEVFYADGRKDYIYNSTFSPFPDRLKTRTKVWGLGFSKGHFWFSYELWRHNGKRNTIFQGYKSNQQAMCIGLQMSTSRDKQKPLERAKKRAHARLGMSKIATMAPWRRAGSGSGWSIDGTVHLNHKYHVSGSFQLATNGFGYDKYVPQYDDQSFLYLPNSAGYIKRHTLLLGRTLHPYRLVKTYLSAGLGYYMLENEYDNYIEPFPRPNSKINFKSQSLGVVFGGGLRYKFVHTNLLFHNSFRTVPIYMEWNIGGCFVF